MKTQKYLHFYKNWKIIKFDFNKFDKAKHFYMATNLDKVRVLNASTLLQIKVLINSEGNI